MSGYLIDTQTITYWFDGESGRFPHVQQAAEARRGIGPLYVSVISLGEIRYGYACQAGSAGAKRDEFLKFLREELPQVLTIKKHTSEPYGQVRAALFERFAPHSRRGRKQRAEELIEPATGRELGIDENDLWLVAQAIERNLVLVTNDKMTHIREAVRAVYPDFTFDNWSVAPGDPL